MAKSKGTARKIALGALFGAVAGVAAGFLTAPKSGKQTRADIKSKAKDIKAEALKKSAATKSKLQSKATTKIDESVTKAKDIKAKAAKVSTTAKKGVAKTKAAAKK
jgi:gas vesicle protein